VRRAGATGPMVLRADSGFYSSKGTASLARKAEVSYSVTVRTSKALHKVIAAIEEEELDTDPVLDRRRLPRWPRQPTGPSPPSTPRSASSCDG